MALDKQLQMNDFTFFFILLNGGKKPGGKPHHTAVLVDEGSQV